MRYDPICYRLTWEHLHGWADIITSIEVGTMKKVIKSLSCGLALAISGALWIAPAQADKPSWAGGGKGKSHEERERGHESRSGGGKHFDDRRHKAIRDYYVQEHRSGHCPPGLAKKNNGCMPPGQAKKWNMGRPLPRDVVFYDLPPQLVVKLGVPPAGHKYVRVASDILLIAVGTSMVVDAINDLGRL